MSEPVSLEVYDLDELTEVTPTVDAGNIMVILL